MENSGSLQKKRVLVLEDSGLISMEIELALRDIGVDPVRVDSVAAALAVVSAQHFDCALVNFHLSDGPCTPVVSKLAALGCPVAIVSGGEARHIEESIGKYPFFRKPVDARQLADWVSKTLGLPYGNLVGT